MQILELTEPKKAIIQFVCTKAQDSLVRIHSGKSVYSPKMSLILRKLGLTYDEYLQYSSDAFYDYQVVLEDPEKIRSMSKGFTADFLAIADIWEPELTPAYGESYLELLTEIYQLNQLQLTALNLN